MRILNVRFLNLNSLVGEWEIDLTAEAFLDGGLFAITGPTGAGKTTILDAICLALYGRTPRLSKVNKSGNEIMSRQAGECFAEVAFEARGRRYRAHWQQWRSRKKSNGELQQQKHELAELGAGQAGGGRGVLISEKGRAVEALIAEITGLDFDRFTRSAMLAQGGFSAFLNAADRDRSAILEELTHTGIYGEISTIVFRRQSEEEQRLAQLRAAAAIAVLDDAQVAEFTRALQEKEAALVELDAEHEGARQALAWLAGLADLRREIADLEAEEEALAAELSLFAPSRARLERADRAARLEADGARLFERREQRSRDEAALLSIEATLPRIADALGAAETALAAALSSLDQARGAERREADVLKDVRALDQKIAGQRAETTALAGALAEEADGIDRERREIEATRARLASARGAQAAADAYLTANARDERLVSELTGIEARLGVLEVKRRTVARGQAALARAEEAVAEAREASGVAMARREERRLALVAANEAIAQGAAALDELLSGRSLREHRADRDALVREQALRQRIAALEAQRALLEDGKACPLCGAEDHPFARGNVPVVDEVARQVAALDDLIGRAEALEIDVAARARTAQASREALLALDATCGGAEQAIQGAAASYEEAAQALRRAREDLAAERREIAVALEAFGVEVIPEADVEGFIAALRARQKAWQEKSLAFVEAERRIGELRGEVGRQEAVVATREAALAARRAQLTALTAALERAEGERFALYGGRDPDVEERRLRTAVAAAEAGERQAREESAARARAQETASARIDLLRRRVEQASAEIAEATSAFESALEAAGFAGEEEWQGARLLPEARALLADRAKALSDRQTALAARQRDRQARLVQEEARRLCDLSEVEATARADRLSAAIQALREEVGGLRSRLSADAAAREQIGARRAAIEAQEREWRRWKDLNALIGSGSGDKYRTFAQGLTFDLVLGHANAQLRQMSDRYLLQRSGADSLEISVIDNYQAGLARTARNLSGGESFIVSLALALGLSRMASRNVRVDSLFLDEGFGALDEASLEVALDALAGLRQEGKLIGVISHVAALKERIGTQIQVRPERGGRSRLLGPGCRAVRAPT